MVVGGMDSGKGNSGRPAGDLSWEGPTVTFLRVRKAVNNQVRRQD